MYDISIFGTSSDSGKSIITMAICYILKKRGFNIAPFKAQNMSNNAYVCDDGGEIGVAQYFQAKAIDLKTSSHLNPILLKTHQKSSVQLIIQGKFVQNIGVKDYFLKVDSLKNVVKESFFKLKQEYELLVCEGAGSPVELNLKKKDLSNIFVAREFNTKIILVADIEKGGVFASIYGTYNLLDADLKKNVIGVIINKFRGDISLFDEGIQIIQNKFQIPVLGVVPYKPFNLGFEDSMSISQYSQKKDKSIKVAIVRFPNISNYNDFEPLICDDNIECSFITSASGLDLFDLIILPGSKSTIKDLLWLKNSDFYEKLKNYKNPILGICGGFEMFFAELIDEDGVENDKNFKTAGLNFVDDEIIFKNNKLLKKDKYKIFDCEVDGFEIHCGVSKKYPLFFEKNNIYGTFVHGLFDNNNFREMFFKKIDKNYQTYNFQNYKDEKIAEFCNMVEEHIDIEKILKIIC